MTDVKKRFWAMRLLLLTFATSGLFYTRPILAEPHNSQVNNESDNASPEYKMIVGMPPSNGQLNEYKQTPLMMAFIDQKYDLAEKLLDEGASLSSVDKFGNNALMHSLSSRVTKKSLKLSLRMIQEGSDVHAKTYPGVTALHLACKHNGANKVIKALIEKGVAVDVATKLGVTPLINASAEATAILLKLGANPNHVTHEAISNHPTTALMSSLRYAATLDNPLQKVKLLLENGAKVDTVNKADFSVMHYIPAVRGYRLKAEDLIEIIDLLVKRGANINAMNISGQRPIHQLAKVSRRYPKTIKVMNHLLDIGVNIDSLNQNGETPLFIACQFHKQYEKPYAVVKFLLEKGANPNIATKFIEKDQSGSRYKDKIDETPLLAAARNGSAKIAQLLLDSGADAYAKNHLGQNVLEAYDRWLVYNNRATYGKNLDDVNLNEVLENINKRTPRLIKARNVLHGIL